MRIVYALSSVVSEWQAHLQAFLTGLDGSNISGNATTDDDQVLLLCDGPISFVQYNTTQPSDSPYQSR